MAFRPTDTMAVLANYEQLFGFVAGFVRADGLVAILASNHLVRSLCLDTPIVRLSDTPVNPLGFVLDCGQQGRPVACTKSRATM